MRKKPASIGLGVIDWRQPKADARTNESSRVNLNMRVVAAFFAENLEASATGRIHVFGGCFDHIRLPKIPCEVSLRVFIRCEFAAGESGGEKNLAMTVINIDGNISHEPSESDRFAAAEARLPTDEELLSTEEEPTDWYRESSWT